jgi:hypothetical protein
MWRSCSEMQQFLLKYDSNGLSTVKQTLQTNCCNFSIISEQERHNTLAILFRNVQLQAQTILTKNNIYYSLKHFKEVRHQFKRLRRGNGLYTSVFLYSYKRRIWSSNEKVGKLQSPGAIPILDIFHLRNVCAPKHNSWYTFPHIWHLIKHYWKTAPSYSTKHENHILISMRLLPFFYVGNVILKNHASLRHVAPILLFCKILYFQF